MIYADHNFTSNFCNAVGSGDEFMTNQIVIDELARHIVENKNDVVKLLRDNGINVSVNDNAKTISKSLTREIAKGNKNISKQISIQIIGNRFDSKKFIGATGQVDPSSIVDDVIGSNEKESFWSKLWGGTKDVGGEIIKNEQFKDVTAEYLSGLLNKTFNKENPQDTSKNTNQLDERLLINQTKQNAKQNTKGVLIAIGVVASITIMTILVVRAKRQAS